MLENYSRMHTKIIDMLENSWIQKKQHQIKKSVWHSDLFWHFFQHHDHRIWWFVWIQTQQKNQNIERKIRKKNYIQFSNHLAYQWFWCISCSESSSLSSIFINSLVFSKKIIGWVMNPDLRIHFYSAKLLFLSYSICK